MAGADSAEPEGNSVRHQTDQFDQIRRRAALQRVPRGQPDGTGTGPANR